MIAVAIIGVARVAPQQILPVTGTLQISIASDPSSSFACSLGQGHNQVTETLTSLILSISSIEVHRTGALNLTGDWISLTNFPKTVDIVGLKNVGQLLGSAALPEGTLNLVRLDIAGVTGSTGSGPATVHVSGNHLDALIGTEVTSGMRTSIVVEPHIVCEGNGGFRVTPDLTATATKSSD